MAYAPAGFSNEYGVASQGRPTLNPPNDNEFDSSLLSALVLLQCLYWEQ
jgi:hypothetical protein